MKKSLKILGDWLVILLVFVLGILSLIGSLYMTYGAIFSKKWVETSGQIIRSYTQKDSKGNSYKPYVDYIYQVDGKTYRSQKLSFDGSLSNNFLSKETAQGKILHYPKDENIKVYYDPLFPSIACLEKGGSLNFQYLMSLVGIVFMYIGYLGVCDSVNRKEIK